VGPADSQTARSLGGTAAFAVLAVGLLLYDHLERNVPALIFWLSMALIVAILAWMIQRSQALAAAEAAAEGSIDPVTGLESRAGLERELEAALSPPASHRALLVFELDGLRAYNAHFGHAAGEEVLRRTARSLAEWAAPLGGTAYRIEDCRLAVLCDLEDGEAGPVALAAEAALHAREGEIPLGWHHGEVALPAEAGDPETAIQLAEKNLDAQGDRQHRSARRQAHSVLVRCWRRGGRTCASTCGRSPTGRSRSPVASASRRRSSTMSP
jgi:GGDEF domain-containing protein